MSRVVTPPIASPPAVPKVTHDRIAMRAYEKWLQRGCCHGSDQQDWLEAEAELNAEVNRTTSPSRPGAPVHPVARAPQPAPAAARRR